MSIKTSKPQDLLDKYFMQLALEEANHAFFQDEVPVGALIVYNKTIIGRGYNCKESWQSPTAHAEMIALEEAATQLKRWRLTDCTAYITLEPCSMCAGAFISARIKRLVFALSDAKSGACGSVYNIAQNPKLNHTIEVVGGVCANQSLALLQNFFRRKRKKK